MPNRQVELLHERIQLLKEIQQAEWTSLKSEVQSTIQPANMLKRGFNNMVNSPDLKQSALSIGLGLATAFITKKIIVGKEDDESNTSFGVKNIIGNLAEYAIMGLVSYLNDKTTQKKEAE